MHSTINWRVALPPPTAERHSCIYCAYAQARPSTGYGVAQLHIALVPSASSFPLWLFETSLLFRLHSSVRTFACCVLVASSDLRALRGLYEASSTFSPPVPLPLGGLDLFNPSS
ncbi:hypothetical protein GOP47_0004992 [Adiantum capillus-veneris]|uniref:Uncharacterized protein n=1 Tax=Adiantum capillus-veneris TaxID=13818 RepID=A0A9D4V4J4_ADICA|nr:hypothetical protein GOP47_0004992 [Adiantum capillus-veneris]